jgi:hypothetical protein
VEYPCIINYVVTDEILVAVSGVDPDKRELIGKVMIKYSAQDALKLSRENLNSRKYPDAKSPRFDDGMMFPVIKPSFVLKPDAKIFTIGSCFARNIEAQLRSHKVFTREFTFPAEETRVGGANTLLNEYNAGAIAARISNAATQSSLDDALLIENKGGYIDMLLSGGVPVSKERGLERRAEMNDLYANMVKSDLLIVTLGLVEAWYDTETGMYLNQSPALLLGGNPEFGKRFELHVLDTEACVELLAPAFELAFKNGLKQLMLTVSPVPLQTTFSGEDAVTANFYSKSTLRGTAEQLTRMFDNVDYFPSYEMVTTYTNGPFIEDNVHVKPAVVNRITKYMIAEYSKKKLEDQ